MPVSTPCRNVCVLDPAAGLCTGCGRTPAEIGAWTAMPEPHRRAIMARLPARLAASARLVRPDEPNGRR